MAIRRKRIESIEDVLIFDENGVLDIGQTVTNVSVKSTYVKPWREIAKEYYGKFHPIVFDHSLRPNDLCRKDGKKDKVAKIVYEAEKLTTRNATQMGFTNPVSRTYDTEGSSEAETALREAQRDAIEKVYASVRIDGENINRMYAYFAACEIITIWYAEDTGVIHNEYGFPTRFKLRCRSYSPAPEADMKITQADIYPVFSKTDDLIALAFQYDYTVIDKKSTESTTQYFEIYTSDTHYQFVNYGNEWEQEEDPKPIVIGKIPGVYLRRPQPVWSGIESYRDEIEFALSRESDILRKTNKPILVLRGVFEGDEKPTGNESREVYQATDGGGIDQIAPVVTYEASRSFIDELKDTIQEVTQFPDLSQSKVVGQGIVSAAARETLLIPAHLRIGGEAPDIEKFLDREGNVIKSFLGILNVSWANTINDLKIEHKLVPYSFAETTIDVTNMANGVTAGIISKKTAIEYINIAPDVDAELDQINYEIQQSIEAQQSADRLI